MFGVHCPYPTHLLPPPPLHPPSPPRCSSDIVSGVEHLLQHVSSIKALASIKSAVHSLLSAPPAPPPEDDQIEDSTHNAGDDTRWAERWVEVCNLILNKELSIWESFFGPTLLKRVQVSNSKTTTTNNSNNSNKPSYKNVVLSRFYF